MESCDRVKEVRKSLGLTLEKFGNRLGVTKTSISNIENGNRNLTEQMTKAICREFHVNEKWLRTGKGEIFIQTNRKDDIADMVNNLMTDESNEFKTRFINLLANLNVDEWKVLEKMVLSLSGGINQGNSGCEAKDDIDAKVEAYRRELELEAKATEKSSVSQEDAS